MVIYFQLCMYVPLEISAACDMARHGKTWRDLKGDLEARCGLLRGLARLSKNAAVGAKGAKATPHRTVYKRATLYCRLISPSHLH